jgi:hypothetical protein
VPKRAGGGQQGYFVGFPENEVIVRIRSDADARRCRAEASERFQSQPVIVLKRTSPFGCREAAAMDAGGFSSEGIKVHAWLMAGVKIGLVGHKSNRKFLSIANTLFTPG